MNKFYVYILLDPRKPGKLECSDVCFLYQPFYVGKGSGKRIESHFYNDVTSMGTNRFKKNVINKIKKELGKKHITVKIKTDLQENESFELEKKLIKELGRRDKKEGCLTNLTDGGEGISGYKYTEEQRKRLSESRKGFGNPMFGRKQTKKRSKQLNLTETNKQ